MDSRGLGGMDLLPLTTPPTPRGVGRRTVLRWFMSLAFLITFCDTQGYKITIGVFPPSVPLAERALDHLRAHDVIRLETLPEVEDARAIDRLIKLYNKINHRSLDVIVGPYDEMVGLALTKLQLPYVVTSHVVTSQMTRHQGAFEVLPHPDDICDVMLEIMKEYQWTRVGLIFQSDVDFRIIARLLDERSIDIKFWKMGRSKEAMRTILLANRDKGIEKTLVMMTSANTQKLLRMSRRLGLINPINEWLILNMESRDVSNHTLDHIQTNVTTIHLVRPRNLLRPGDYVSDTSPSGPSLNYAVMLDALRAVAEAQKLLVPDGTGLLEEAQRNTSSTHLLLAKALPKVSFEGLTGVVEFDPRGRRINLTFTIHRFKKTAFQQIGEWVSNSLPSPRLSFPTPSPRKDRNSTNAFPLRGKTVRVVTILEEPFTMYVDDYKEKTGNARFKGFAVDLMREIATMLGFNFELYLVPDGKFGSKNADGTWNGMIGEVLAQRAVMTVAPLSINAEREKVIDFTKPFKTRGITVLMRTPKSHPSYFQFLKPLSPHVWLCTILAVVTVSVLLYVLERYAVTSLPVAAQRAASGGDGEDDEGTMDVQESCWFVFGSLVQGGTDSSPTTLGGRILTSAWWLFALMMVSTYTANLAAFLTVKKIQPPISSVTDLAHQTAIKFGTVRNSGVETFFTNTKIQSFINMRTHMTELFPDAMVNSTEEGLRRAKAEDYAFLWDNTVTSYKASVDCEYTEIGPPFDPKGFGLAVPSGATYREDLSIAILRLGDQGKIVELEHKYWDSEKCESQEKSKSDLTSELRLENVAGIFFILLAGMVFAFSSCACSSLYNHRRRAAARRPK